MDLGGPGRVGRSVGVGEGTVTVSVGKSRMTPAAFGRRSWPDAMARRTHAWRTILTAMLVIGAAVTSAGAQVYHWIDDQGVIKDSMNTINLYLLLQSSHSNNQLMVYYANAKMVTLADVYMPNDPRVMIPNEPFGHQPWIQNVLANFQYRKLQVETLAPVHGDVEPFNRFMEESVFLTAKPPTADR